MRLFRKNVSGQSLPLTLLVFAIVTALVFSNIDRMHMMVQKIKVQKQADAIALTTATELARSYNALAMGNQGIEQLATQIMIFMGTALSSLILSVIFSRTLAIKIALSAASATDRFLTNIGKIADAMDKQIHTLHQQSYVNLCHEITKNNIAQLISFARIFIPEAFQNISLTDIHPREYLELAKVVSMLKEPFVRIYPNVCDAQSSSEPDILRVDAADGHKQCETSEVQSIETLTALQRNSFTQDSIVRGEGVYQFDPLSETDSAPLVQTTKLFFEGKTPSETILPTSIYLDNEGKKVSSGAKTFRFRFVSGSVRTCIDADDVLANIKHGLSPKKLPPKVRGGRSFEQSSTFMIHVAVPYFSLKPFRKSQELLTPPQARTGISTLDDVRSVFESQVQWINDLNELRLMLSQTQKIEVYSQFTIKGDPSFDHPNFHPALMSPTLASDFEQEGRR